MTLSAGNIEKAARLLWALEQRIASIHQSLALAASGQVPGVVLALTTEQHVDLGKTVSALVGEAEELTANLETEVKGATDIKPGVPGLGITDEKAALDGIVPLTWDDSGVHVGARLVHDLYNNIGVPRDTSGELVDAAIEAEQLAKGRLAFILRIEGVKLALGQLRVLGA